MTIEVNLKNGNNYIFKNVTAHADLAWDPIWFWVDCENHPGRRYIAASEIQDILIQEESK